MAKIVPLSAEKIFRVQAWTGLNENPDGDTKLKQGEAAVMRNWAITRDMNLRRRRGSRTVATLTGGGAVSGMWNGRVKGKEYALACSGGKLWKLWEEGQEAFAPAAIGELNTDKEVHLFGFSDILYIINGQGYYQWDGTTFKAVEGYVPLVTIAVPPQTAEGAGHGGDTLEKVNRLTGKRRLWLSPDGKGDTFKLPEDDVQSIDYVKDLKTGSSIPASDYTADTAAGTVKFNTAPMQSVNSYEIGWTVANPLRAQVEAMRFGELYDGTQDTRVFLYGDGSNRVIYSGLDYDGQPRADYFPDLNDVSVGSENEAVTALIRHYSTLVCFKENSAWAIVHGMISLADGSQIPAFYCSPVNRTIGNAALGQARLVLNSPVTLHGSDLYEWRNTSSYSSNLSIDERQAKRISDRIYQTLSSFDAEGSYCYDDNYAQEYYICCGNKCLVHNYAADAWYCYDGITAKCMMNIHGELFFGTPDGRIKHLSYRYLSDDGEAIDAYWESGSLSFGNDNMRKFSALTWIGIKPDPNGEVTVTVQTDRKSNYPERIVASSLATFGHASFARWNFSTNRKPQMHRLKIKAKKFVYYKLIFKNSSPDTQATVLAADIRVRATGYAK